MRYNARGISLSKILWNESLLLGVSNECSPVVGSHSVLLTEPEWGPDIQNLKNPLREGQQGKGPDFFRYA